MKKAILTKIKSNKVVVGIIGLGYVGLPLAITFASKNIKVLGFDNCEERVEKIKKSESYIDDVDKKDLAAVVKNNFFSATTDMRRLCECDAILICVPTPLDEFRKPKMDHINDACIAIGKNMKKGTFISLESTTYPTTTEEFMLPIIQRESKLLVGKDFWLAFSPERVDPGNKKFKTENTPKVLGAMTKDGLEIGMALYSKAINEIHTVSSPSVAEMVKILENTYRLINISLINELALLADKMNINIWEVIEAAKTKPYGFQAFYPGPGVGGHCIPLDPFYLEHIAKKYNIDLEMIHTAGHINSQMPTLMAQKIADALNSKKKAVNGSKILLLGVAYKPNVNDERESAALRIIDALIEKGGKLFYNDPLIKKIKTPKGNNLASISLNYKNLSKYDCVVITTKHEEYDPAEIKKNAPLIVDLQNLLKKDKNIFKL